MRGDRGASCRRKRRPRPLAPRPGSTPLRSEGLQRAAHPRAHGSASPAQCTCSPRRAASMSAERMRETMALRASLSAANSQLRVSGLPAGRQGRGSRGRRGSGERPATGSRVMRAGRAGPRWWRGPAARTRAAAAVGADVGQRERGLLAHVERGLLEQAHEGLRAGVARDSRVREAGRARGRGWREGGVLLLSTRIGACARPEEPRIRPCAPHSTPAAGASTHRHGARRLERLQAAPPRHARHVGQHPAGLALQAVVVALRGGGARGGRAQQDVRRALRRMWSMWSM